MNKPLLDNTFIIIIDLDKAKKMKLKNYNASFKDFDSYIYGFNENNEKVIILENDCSDRV